MEQLSHDYSYQTETRRDGVLESASKRVRMIFSVMASPNRIDILRILNSKGPLTYSELKSLAGFKSKKESGKFAYHLRKLLRQSLVALNKAERRYTITNLGKLVLSLARQIEERSIIESGKMYVRTTRHSIEEFNSHKIIQSLVREANMPLEQANKITEEVENKIYKFQTSYLTSSLIRETVNSVLIEHGHEEYRNKLARLGLPASDIVEILNNIDKVKNGADSIMSKASQSVFSEHLMLNILPKDIADMHLNGEISISNSGIWSLLPDTVFLNITDFAEVGLDLKGKFLNVSRIPAIKNSDDLGIALPILISLLSREVSTEIVLDGIIPLLLEDQLREPNEIASRFENILIASSVAPSYSPAGLPVTTITVQLDKFDKKSIDAVLSGYRSYIASTPVPRIGICLINNDKLKDYTDAIASIVRTGGIISILQNGSRSNNGVRKNIGGKGSGTVMTLQSLSINLPRLAYQSNKDETYFRARLALMIKPALSAMSMRKKAIADLIRKQMIPVIANSAQFIQLGTTNVIINLTGIEESVYKILGHDASNDGAEILQKVLKTAVDVAAEYGKQLGEDSIGIAMIHDDSATRFATLDSDKYGKISLLTSNQQKTVTYSQGLTLNARELLLSDNNKHNSVIKECISIDNILNGGLSLTLDVSELYSDEEVKNAIESAADLPFFRLMSRVLVCNTCGKRSSTQSSERCEYCKSPYLLMI
ncbi:MAG TPA: anaerobic ribonucleoside-triphosphate reductase [Nitrososphaeraceae archaeon]|jgi:ribonucleoside-triphosphate reductase|nr:anaerobic ribonucleoside-triphosphate reductase [Nitrososphaeraceae archaeon]